LPVVLVGVVIAGVDEGVIEVGLTVVVGFAVAVGIKLGSGLATPGAGVKFSGVNGGSALGAVDTWPFEYGIVDCCACAEEIAEPSPAINKIALVLRKIEFVLFWSIALEPSTLRILFIGSLHTMVVLKTYDAEDRKTIPFIKILVKIRAWFSQDSDLTCLLEVSSFQWFHLLFQFLCCGDDGFVLRHCRGEDGHGDCHHYDLQLHHPVLGGVSGLWWCSCPCPCVPS
jgi:hypothetical protein